MDSFMKAVERLGQITMQVGVLFGESKVLIESGRLEEGAQRIEQIGALYMELADMLRNHAKEMK